MINTEPYSHTPMIELMSLQMRTFKWESDDQKKGFWALIQYLRPIVPEGDFLALVTMVSCFFIQKDHESNVWWAETMGAQISSLEKQISLLQTENASMQKQIQEIRLSPDL